MSACVHRVAEVDLALPLDRYRAAFGEQRGGFLLDGAGGDGAGLARHALLGGAPTVAFRAFRTGARDASGRALARVVVRGPGGVMRDVIAEPFAALGEVLAEHAVPRDAYAPCPLPLLAGAVGYVGYETGQVLERLPGRARPRQALPDMAFFLHDWVLGTCRQSGRAWLSVIGRGGSPAEAERVADATSRRVRESLARVERASRREAAGPATQPPAPAPGHRAPADIAALASALGVRAALSRDGYLDAVTLAKRHIEEGDAFEICLTNSLEAPFPHDPWELFRELRRASPAPFAAWLDMPEAAIVSSSPERFVSLDASGVAESRPIKGTRPRGRDADEDAALARELADAEKDRAENTMIVDLVRNDLGRVCRLGSVEVPALCAVESYASVHQMVSTVRGHVDDGRDAIDVLRACFPPGSMTGAPKIEAMSILEQLEPVERGIYAGALGYIDLRGTMDLSVVIRTAVVAAGVARFGVGGAVVADSSPEAEHDETLVKARGMLEALEAVEGRAAARRSPRETTAGGAPVARSHAS